MIPWGLTPARVSILAAAVAIACAVSASVTWWGFATPRIEAAEQRARADVATLGREYEKGRADGQAAATKALQDSIERTGKINDQRIADYQAIAAAADARAAGTGRALSLCLTGDRAATAPGGGAARPRAGHDVPAGVLDGGDGSDPGAVLKAKLDAYAARVEVMSADLRACDANQGKK